MRKYSLLISFVIALTVVGCTVIMIKHKEKSTELKPEININKKPLK